MTFRDKKIIIQTLQDIYKNKNKSPGRRDVGTRLYFDCCTHFGSFNNAKVKAGLNIYRRNRVNLPPISHIKDINLVKILAYLTCDGHLSKDLKSFYLSSANRNGLLEFQRIVYKKFNLRGLYEFSNNSWGKSIIYRICSVEAAEFLKSMGAPQGEKVLSIFNVPLWIRENKEFARHYLAICFLCEGYKSKDSKIIEISFNKEVSILDSGILFLNSLKYLLSLFEIESSKVYVKEGNIRKKDNKIIKILRIRIRGKNTDRFIKEIGWYK